MVLNLVRQPRANYSLDSVVSDLFADFQWMHGYERTGRIPVNVQEHEDRYELVAELPGLSKENLRISVEKGVLTIRGERKPVVDASKARLVHSEITTGAFERSFVIPKDVEAAGLDARLSNGILHLTMPKAEHSLPREITVK